MITENTPKKYKYIVTGITTGTELKKIMNSDLYIIGISLTNFSDDINNLPRSLKSFELYDKKLI